MTCSGFSDAFLKIRNKISQDDKGLSDEDSHASIATMSRDRISRQYPVAQARSICFQLVGGGQTKVVSELCKLNYELETDGCNQRKHALHSKST